MKNFRDYTVKISPQAKDAKEVLEAADIPVSIFDNKYQRGGGHPASAGVRSYLTNHALVELYRKGCRKILSVYGSARDVKIARALNKGVPAQDAFTVDVWRPVETPEDVHREEKDPHIHDTMPVGPFDGYFMCDIYALGPVPFTPQNILNIIGDKPLVWIGHKFPGPFGDVCGEGAWVRVRAEGQEWINFVADESETIRNLHDPCDWVCIPGHEALPLAGVPGRIMWGSGDAGAGGMVEIHFKWKAGAPTKVRSAPPSPTHAWESLPIPDRMERHMASGLIWLAGHFHWVSHLLPKKIRLVDLELKRILVDQFPAGSFTPYKWRSMVGAANQKKSSDPIYCRLSRIFPKEMATVVESTALAAFLDDTEGKAQAMEWVNASHGRDMHRYNAAVASVGMAPPTASWTGTLALGFGAASLGLFFIWRAYAGYRALCKPTALPPGVSHAAVVVKNMVGHVGSTSTASGPWYEYGFSLAFRLSGWLVDRLPDMFGVFDRVRLPKVDPKAFDISWLWKTNGWWSPIMGLLGCAYRLPHVEILTHVVLEETVKIWPLAGRVMMAYEVFEKLVGMLALPLWLWPLVMLGTGAAYAMHEFTLRFPFHKRVAIHYAWNVVCHTLTGFFLGEGFSVWGVLVAAFSWIFGLHRPTPWKQFRNKYYDSPWEERGCWPTVTKATLTEFDPEDGIVSREVVPWIPNPKPRDLEMRVVPQFEPTDVEEQATLNTYFFLPTNIPVYAPATSELNVYSLIRGRLCIEPPLEMTQQLKVWAAERSFHQKLLGKNRKPISWAKELHPWLEHIEDGMKRRRAIAALAHYALNGLDVTDREVNRSVVFPKTDEVLLQHSEAGVQMKPRPIINVHPNVLVRMGPEVWKATSRLHGAWPWVYTEKHHNFRCGKWTFRITFGSDATDVKLTEWYRDAYEWVRAGPWRAWFIVAGDDTLGLVRGKSGVVYFLEGDFSMFDQSQSLGPLQAEMEGLRKLGVCDFVIKLLYRIHAGTYILRSKHNQWKISHHHRPMRATGGPDTTFGNSHSAGCAWASVLRWGLLEGDLLDSAVQHAVEAGMLRLGFVLKLKVTIDVQQVTFLKGAWVEFPRGLVWAPLPSRILKLGKGMSNPLHLYPGRTYEEACMQYMNDMAASYRKFAMVPCVKGFVDAFLRGPAERDLFVAKPWKVPAGYDESPGVPSGVQGLAARYGCSEDDLWDLDSWVAKAKLFTFLQHPLLGVLASRDYN